MQHLFSAEGVCCKEASLNIASVSAGCFSLCHCLFWFFPACHPSLECHLTVSSENAWVPASPQARGWKRSTMTQGFSVSPATSHWAKPSKKERIVKTELRRCEDRMCTASGAPEPHNARWLNLGLHSLIIEQRFFWRRWTPALFLRVPSVKGSPVICIWPQKTKT